MERYIDVMKRTVELSDTCLKAIQHIHDRLEEGFSLKELNWLILDVIQAIYQMEISISPLLQKLSTNELPSLIHKLRNTLEKLVSACEWEEDEFGLEIIKIELLSNYLEWKKELEKCLYPYFIS